MLHQPVHTVHRKVQVRIWGNGTLARYSCGKTRRQQDWIDVWDQRTACMEQVRHSETREVQQGLSSKPWNLAFNACCAGPSGQTGNSTRDSSLLQSPHDPSKLMSVMAQPPSEAGGRSQLNTQASFFDLEGQLNTHASFAVEEPLHTHASLPDIEPGLRTSPNTVREYYARHYQSGGANQVRHPFHSRVLYPLQKFRIYFPKTGTSIQELAPGLAVSYSNWKTRWGEGGPGEGRRRPMDDSALEAEYVADAAALEKVPLPVTCGHCTAFRVALLSLRV